jgi:hypothetical protein
MASPSLLTELKNISLAFDAFTPILSQFSDFKFDLNNTDQIFDLLEILQDYEAEVLNISNL